VKLQIQVQVKKFSECLVFTHFNTDKGIKKRMSLVKVMLINYSHFIKLTIHLLDRPAMEKLSHLLFRNINEIIIKKRRIMPFCEEILSLSIISFLCKQFQVFIIFFLLLFNCFFIHYFLKQ